MRLSQKSLIQLQRLLVVSPGSVEVSLLAAHNTQIVRVEGNLEEKDEPEQSKRDEIDAEVQNKKSVGM